MAVVSGTDTAELRKARGAFFTPPEIADFLTEWAVRSVDDSVLEPSCGEAAFLVSAAERLRSLGSLVVGQLVGVELHEESARMAAGLVAAAGASADISTGDFFDFETDRRFEAVIGNPPYVRYQDFVGDARTKGQEAALAQGVRLTGLASSWAAFVVHATRYLKPGGRLALVLPAELLSVNYASDVRRFLMSRFGRVRLVTFEERVFPGVLEEVVLLLAEGRGPTDHFTLVQARGLNDLSNVENLTSTWSPLDADGKWTAAFLPRDVLTEYTSLTTSEDFGNVLDWGETSLGMVTGNNRYFCLSAAEAAEAGLTKKELLSISPPGSRHLRGLTFTQKSWDELAAAGKKVYLFHPCKNTNSKAALRYIADGEAIGVQEAYKCRVRSPWWRVPLVSPPDLFLTYMNHDTPRLAANRAGVRYLNSVHGVVLKKGRKALGLDLLPIAALNSLTALGAEVVGRAYGGGMLKLEPKEADLLPVPSFDLLDQAAPRLRALRPQLGTSLRQGNMDQAVKLVDDVLLVGELGLKRGQVQRLRDGRSLLFERREARTGKASDGQG